MISNRPIATRPIAVGAAPASGAASYTLTVDVGALTLNGQSVTLKTTRVLTVTFAGVTLAGQSIDLRYGGPLFIVPAAILLTGQTVTLSYSGGEEFQVSSDDVIELFPITGVSEIYGVSGRTA